MAKIEIVGYEALMKMLQALPVEADKKIIAASLRKALNKVLEVARDNVPVKSGELKQMLKISNYRRVRSKTEKAMSVRHVWAKRQSDSEDSGNQYYGIWVHEGAAERKPKRGKKFLRFKNKEGEIVFCKKVAGIKRQPYIEVAFTREGNNIIPSFAKSFGPAVEKYSSKYFKRYAKSKGRAI